MSKQRIAKTLVGLGCIGVSSSILAAGLELVREPTAILFEEGRYLEASVGRANPEITDSNYAKNKSAANDLRLFSAGYKADFNDQISYAITRHEPLGLDLNYKSTVALPFKASAKLDSISTGLTGRYKFNDNISAIAGVKQIQVSGAITLGAPIKANTDKAVGYTFGAVYEQKDIALRVSLIHSPKIDLSLDSTAGNGTLALAPTKGAAAATTTLNFQTGVAENTLLFGSIHQSEWSDAQITIDAITVGKALTTGTDTPISEFKDTTVYTIGLGQRLNEQFAVSLTYSQEPGTQSSGDTLLSPTDGTDTIGIGGKYSGKSFDISAGVSQSKYGDKKVSSPKAPVLPATEFTGNDGLNYGIKVGVHL